MVISLLVSVCGIFHLSAAASRLRAPGIIFSLRRCKITAIFKPAEVRSSFPMCKCAAKMTNVYLVAKCVVFIATYSSAKTRQKAVAGLLPSHVCTVAILPSHKPY